MWGGVEGLSRGGEKGQMEKTRRSEVKQSKESTHFFCILAVCVCVCVCQSYDKMDQNNPPPGSLLDLALDLEHVFISALEEGWEDLWILNLLITPDSLCSLPSSSSSLIF